MNKAFLIITFVFIFINSYSQTNESAKREKAITEEFTELKINNNSTNPSIISLISEYGGQDNDLGRISSWIGDPEIAGLEVARIGMPAYISKSGHITFSTRQEPKFNGPTLTLKERMRISHNGSVGIGTTNPLTKLDVVGDIAIGKGNINFYHKSNGLHLRREK